MSTFDIQKPNSQKFTSPTNYSISADPGIILSEEFRKNTSIGTNALPNHSYANGYNLAIGTDSLKLLSGGAGIRSIGIGTNALGALTNSNYVSNIGLGKNCGKSLDRANTGYNVIVGDTCMQNATRANKIIIIGSEAMKNSTIPTIEDSVLIGYSSNRNSSSASSISSNILLGAQSGDKLTGNNNIIIGTQSAFNLTSGTDNIIIGDSSGLNLVTETECILIGAAGTPSTSNQITISDPLKHTSLICPAANNSIGPGEPLSIVDTYQIGATTLPMGLNSIAQVRNDLSTVRNELALEPCLSITSRVSNINSASDLYKLAVIDFDWDNGERQCGLLAEQVEKYFPDVCTYIDGKLNGINYLKFLPICKAEMSILKEKIDKKLKNKK